MISYKDLQISPYPEVCRAKVKRSVREIVATALRPPPELNLVEWADKYRFLPDNSAEAGRWKTDRVEVAREPMLSVTNPDVQETTVMCCIQLMKALAVTTPMRTRSGWTTMGDLKVGDLIYGKNGKNCKVLAKSDIKIGEKCFRVSFSDGQSIDCDAGHKWSVDDSENRSRTVRKGVVKDTLEISRTFKNDYGNRYAIPVAKPLDGVDRKLPIDPYLLGCWLGDGHSYSSRLTIHKDDTEILREFESRGYGHEKKKTSLSSSVDTREYRIFSLDEGVSIPWVLTEIGLLKGVSKRNKNNEKHLPDIYKTARKKDRIDVLQGLMDTGGTICKLGNTSFSQKSERVTDDFIELALSLGLKTVKRYLKKTDSYIVTFSSYSNFPVFKIKRKAARIKDINTKGLRVSESRRRRIVNVEEIPSVPVQCITVDSEDHLYLCGRGLIPTHNTELMLNAAMYYMHQNPCPIMYVAPKNATAEAWSKERLVKSINVTPVLKDILSGNRRGEGNTILQKQFAGGQISIVSARSETDLAMRAVMVMLFDEIDKYPINVGSGEGGVGGEGDPIAIAWGRATTFKGRAKKICACSPTVKNKSRIEAEYLSSDQREFHQECPHCQKLFVPEWKKHIKLKQGKDGKDTSKGAALVCTGCGVPWSEKDRYLSIKNGKWIAKFPEITWHHGYHVSAFASPFITIEILAREFLKCGDNAHKLKAFYNTRLALTYQDVGESPDWKKLYERRGSYKPMTAPDGVLMITAGIDVQKDYLQYEVVGWGRKKISWSLDIGVMEGHISLDEVKEELAKFLERTYMNEHGNEMMIEMTLIDSSNDTTEVYTAVAEIGSRRLRAIKGQGNLATILGTPKPAQVNIDGIRKDSGVKRWPLGVNILKEQLYRWLLLKTPEKADLDNGKEYPTGYCHFPEWDEEYFKQLTAEILIERTTNRGFTELVWDRLRANHFLDIRNYARAGAEMLGIGRMNNDDWREREKKFGISGGVKDAPEEKTESRKKRPSKWFKRSN